MKKWIALLAVLHFTAQAALCTPSVLRIERRFSRSVPSEWGEHIDGVLRRVPTREKVVYLTFDACGGARGSAFDGRLIALLRRENVPATLFVNARWIDANPRTFLELARDPLFSVQNHGAAHRPLSVTGRSVYGIAGTASPREVYAEIMDCDAKIFTLTGRHPRFFRSGTAYYDDVALRIAASLGYTVAGFDVLGDGGATFSADRIETASYSVRPGSIVICHMNRPDGDTFAGMSRVIRRLKADGWRFGLLEEYARRRLF